MAYSRRPRGSNVNQFSNQSHNSNQNTFSNQSHATQQNASSMQHQTSSSSDQIQLAIKGWAASKLAKEPDAGLSALISFLEKKAARPIHSHKQIGRGVVLITINSSDAPRFHHLNGFTFVGSTLIVEDALPPRSQQINGANNPPAGPRADRMPIDTVRANKGNLNSLPIETQDLQAGIIATIHKRYNAAEKYLAFEALALDEFFQTSGLTQSPASKIFQTLFTLCGTVFETQSKRQEMVTSISLSNNSLTTVKDILSLSATFPNLKNLDLSNNNLEDIGSLRFWKNQFRDLEHIILTNNPVAAKPDTKETLLSWYPKLKFYNNEQIRSDSGQILNGPTMTQPMNAAQPINSFSQPMISSTPQPNIPMEPLPTASHPEFSEGDTFAVPLPGKSEDQLIKEQMGLKFSFETKLKMAFVEQALSANGFNYEAALQNFHQMQSSIPAEAFIPGV